MGKNGGENGEEISPFVWKKLFLKSLPVSS
jgi:hypothetical protein